MVQKIDFAPMEGITGFVFRNAFHQVFSGVDRYYTPFLSPGPDIGIPKRDRRDILPENNRGVPVVPQILTNRAEDFLKTAELLYDFGYREVNLNLGCPSGTVVAKKKGAGFLSEPALLKNFLDDVFYGASRMMPDLRISVKTRIGVNSPEEFPPLLAMFRQYPMSELIIHPRVRKEQYKGLVHMDVFAGAAKAFEGTHVSAAGAACSTAVSGGAVSGGAATHGSAASDTILTYNGDIIDCVDILRIGTQFPVVTRVMCGRGLLRNPCLAEEFFSGMQAEPGPVSSKEIKAQSEPASAAGSADGKREKIRRFHELLVEGYEKAYPENPGIITAKLKELWFYLGDSFPGTEREQKALKKAKTPEELIAAASRILEG
ncbi:MAG: tRNA-dihydrouridine synthase family protein [Stomatobaculum sp.]|nr:tRNA-dihydrouridine synthase family protein [Stomatobaculum sp.]